MKKKTKKEKEEKKRTPTFLNPNRRRHSGLVKEVFEHSMQA